jgi:hypothetical protein
MMRRLLRQGKTKHLDVMPKRALRTPQKPCSGYSVEDTERARRSAIARSVTEAASVRDEAADIVRRLNRLVDYYTHWRSMPRGERRSIWRARHAKYDADRRWVQDTYTMIFHDLT